MDKTVIFGVFDFVSFHICKGFLNKGIEVEGIYFETEEIEDFIDEKRLEIGRNSNFNELSFIKWVQNTNKSVSESVIILSLYDLYMHHRDNLFQKEAETNLILDYMKKNKGNSEKIVLLVPVQLLTNSMDSDALMSVGDFLDNTQELSGNIQLIYLPTIYGPWQPETFIFQQTILKNMNRNCGFKGGREGRSDALFVEDCIQTILEIIENMGAGRYFLESEQENQWHLCAAFLHLDENLSKGQKTTIREDKITKLTIKQQTPITDALTKQKEHVRRIYEN